ncbi:hypothetical protein [Brevundimonas sp. GCM10030266]|uniref:hypothetical protein n=1 Tax=Brevundimonas sp. GCM10030266 TaxID=3273386 RepID=UPI00361E8AD0
MAKDILRRIDADYEQADRPDVTVRLSSLWDMDLNVGPEQLARAILIVASGDAIKLKRVFDTRFHGDPRDIIMAAMAQDDGADYGHAPFR